MSESLADLVKRQQSSSKSTTESQPASAPKDEAAEMSAIAREHAAKAAARGAVLLGKATKIGTRKTVQATQQARQRLAAVTPEQWERAGKISKKLGLAIVIFVIVFFIGCGLGKAWMAWESHHTPAPVTAPKKTPAPTATATKIKSRPPVAKVVTAPVKIKTPVTTTAQQPRPETQNTATAVIRTPAPTIVTHHETRTAAKPHTATAVSPPVRRQARPPKARHVDKQEQKKLQALDKFFSKLNHQGGAHGSQSTHQ